MEITRGNKGRKEKITNFSKVVRPPIRVVFIVLIFDQSQNHGHLQKKKKKKEKRTSQNETTN